MNDILQIFNPDWWIDENNSALEVTDAALFLLFLIPIFYLLIYSLVSLNRYKNPYPTAKKQHRFLIVFAALKNGKEVIESINHLLTTQEYPKDHYDIAVAATLLDLEDLETLMSLPVTILVPDKEPCTKVYAIQQVMQRYSPYDYDAIVIFNSDNVVCPNALTLFNNAYWAGCDAIQGHRMTTNLTSDISILGAITEEINNNVFRKAHCKLGFSSALIGSGMMFDFETFHRIAPTLTGSDLTTALETKLLKENIYVEYLEDLVCYCKKSEDAIGYNKNRRRWSATKKEKYMYALKNLPLSLLQGRWDLCEKLLQWLLPSRFMLVFYILLWAIITTFAEWTLCLKWYGLLLVLIVSYAIALPDGEVSKNSKRAIRAIPTLIYSSLRNAIKYVGKALQSKKKRHEKEPVEETPINN